MSGDGLKQAYKYRWISLCGNVFAGAADPLQSVFTMSRAGWHLADICLRVQDASRPKVMKGVYMSAFFEGFLAGLADPKATKGVVQSGSAFYDWLKGVQQKNKQDHDFDDALCDYKAPDPQGSRSDPFGYFDNGAPRSAEPDSRQGTDRAQIESEKMLKHLEQGIQRFMDSGNPRHNPQQYFNGQVTPRGRHVDPAYDRRR